MRSRRGGTGTKRDRMNARIAQYGAKLKRIFPRAKASGDALARKVHRLEVEAHRMQEARCAAPGVPEEVYEEWEGKFMKRLDALLGYRKAGVKVFMNTDPRGYALKIHDSQARDLDIHRDMGGYGILAPDLTDD